MTVRQTRLGSYAPPDDVAAIVDDLELSRDLADRLDRILTDAEREIYVAVEIGDVGVREFQRRKGWSSPGTASSLLSSAREKVSSASGGNA